MTGKTNGAPPDSRSYRDAVVAQMPPQPARGRPKITEYSAYPLGWLRWVFKVFIQLVNN